MIVYYKEDRELSRAILKEKDSFLFQTTGKEFGFRCFITTYCIKYVGSFCICVSFTGPDYIISQMYATLCQNSDYCPHFGDGESKT